MLTSALDWSQISPTQEPSRCTMKTRPLQTTNNTTAILPLNWTVTANVSTTIQLTAKYVAWLMQNVCESQPIREIHEIFSHKISRSTASHVWAHTWSSNNKFTWSSPQCSQWGIANCTGRTSSSMPAHQRGTYQECCGDLMDRRQTYIMFAYMYTCMKTYEYTCVFYL